MEQEKTVFVEFASALFDYVNHPDYYKGPWKVHVHGRGSKLCKNYETALAWTKYLYRNYPHTVICSLQKAETLPGFPRQL